ncbi:MAG: anaerobic sulfatase maturase [Desulfopila sp.]
MTEQTDIIPFSLLVKPASATCNLRCDYCFYLDKHKIYPGHSPLRMDDAVLERVIHTYLEIPLPVHSFSWQGGEPTLMGLDFFRQVVRYQARFQHQGARITNGIQTNGTLLTAEWARFLARHQFLVGMSLDGPEAIHNRYRTTTTGGGSYSSVLDGINHLKNNRAEFNILTLVSQANIEKPLEVYRFLRDEMQCRHHQYIECVEFDRSGGLTDFSATGKQWGDFLCTIFDEWVKYDTAGVSVRLFDAIITTMLDKRPTMCTLGRDCRHYLVVEHNGDIYPCDFYVEERMKLGNIALADWQSLLSKRQYEAFGKRKRSMSPACGHCSFVGLCAGDCQKNRLTRATAAHSPSLLCDGWKQFYQHAMPTLTKLVQKLERKNSRKKTVPAGTGQTGRNDLCPCGSGRKFKKCCFHR